MVELPSLVPPDAAIPHQRLREAPWLVAASAQPVFAALAAVGHAGRAVGGAVRNSLLDLPVADVDIATTATPDLTMRAAKAAGLAAHPTGIAHGTVTIVSAGVPYEVTTLRRDIATDGRHAVVAFTDDWAADASRRDFTMNALYCDASGRLFDPLGGLPDLEARRVRFVGDPVARIREDYLRILRFFRFTAQYAAGACDREGLAASTAERDGLAQISAERIRAELVKLVIAPAACAALAAMDGASILAGVLGVQPRRDLFDRLVALEASVQVPPDAMRRLAALALTTPDDARRLARRLRMSAIERAALVACADDGPPIDGALSAVAARQTLYHRGVAGYRAKALLDAARRGITPASPEAPASNDFEPWREMFELPLRWTAPDFPIAGRDLLARGIAPGPRVGEILTAAEAWWLEHDFPERHVLDGYVGTLVDPA